MALVRLLRYIVVGSLLVGMLTCSVVGLLVAGSADLSSVPPFERQLWLGADRRLVVRNGPACTLSIPPCFPQRTLSVVYWEAIHPTVLFQRR